ncbi:GntR family transcriptional regulator [Ammoniphilus oxalaticus]|uniref:GntR family transcriptional regulator n=1 Tax=Ammoniphilus oxalaticus TaxID=66863 RepID=A0A419SGE9_9BACL|nr:GntR family transcriptional regulator [Ammoniphilus oxalaticus]RKD22858.1 GntR family transcriptional regulator [Ammoniphilus oxalaticus]
MNEDFNPDQPIYLQLAERISYRITRKELGLGAKLPSVREMAIQASVNPNTVQRAYSELERKGIVETKRGQGTFVTKDDFVLTKLRETLKQEQIVNFVNDMRNMGYSDEEMINGLEHYFQKGGINK